MRHTSPSMIGAGLLTLTTWGCTASMPAVDMAAETASVLARSDAIVAAEVARDFDRAVTFYAADAVIQPANGVQIQGHEAIRALYHEFFEGMMVTEFASTRTNLTVSGDLAYEHGVNRITMGTPPMEDVGKFLAVWAKRDGEWYIVALAFSSDAPPPGM